MNTNKLRKTMISNMESSLKFIKPLLGLSDKEISEFVGISEDRLNDFENNEMTTAEYLSICALIDNKCNKKAISIVNAIIKANSMPSLDIDMDELYDGFFLDKWFSTFHNCNLVKDYEVYGWDKLDEELLVNLASNYKIFVNYDSLMLDNSEEFFSRFAKILKEYKSKLIIPLRVVETLRKFSEEDNCEFAMDGIKSIVKMQNDGVMIIRGEKNDLQQPDDLLINLFKKYNEDYCLAFITQSESLAKELMQIQSFESSLILCKINSQSELIQWNKNILDNVENKEHIEDKEMEEICYEEIDDDNDKSTSEEVDGGWSTL